MSKEEVLNFIRETLRFDSNMLRQIKNLDSYYAKHDEHRRFEMSGYDWGEPGSCVVQNMNILNTFAYLGIYDHTTYLFLDFYKGTPTIYYQYWNTDTHLNTGDSFSAYTTSELIYEVFCLTIFSKHGTRRRD